MNIGDCLGIVAPYYNLVLVIIVYTLFYYLFKAHKGKNLYIKHWKLLLIALIIFTIEQLMVVLQAARVFSYPLFFNGIFEMGIVGCFIYMLLLQKDHIKKNFTKKKR